LSPSQATKPPRRATKLTPLLSPRRAKTAAQSRPNARPARRNSRLLSQKMHFEKMPNRDRSMGRLRRSSSAVNPPARRGRRVNRGFRGWPRIGAVTPKKLRPPSAAAQRPETLAPAALLALLERLPRRGLYFTCSDFTN
jgi:hypothetical protein